MVGGQERPQVGRDPGPAEAVTDPVRRPPDGQVRRAVSQHARQPGQRGREGEDLGAGDDGGGSHQVQVRRGVGLHRLADVAQHQQPPWATNRMDPVEVDGLEAGPPGTGHGAAQRDPAPAASLGHPPRRATRPSGQGGAEPVVEQRQRRWVEVGERRVGDGIERAGRSLGHRQRTIVGLVGPHDTRQPKPRKPLSGNDFQRSSGQRRPEFTVDRICLRRPARARCLGRSGPRRASAKTAANTSS